VIQRLEANADEAKARLITPAAAGVVDTSKHSALSL
jgi:hypothetical protein